MSEFYILTQGRSTFIARPGTGQNSGVVVHNRIISYIYGMKKAITVLVLALLAVSILGANGVMENQNAFYENLQNRVPDPNRTQSAGATTVSDDKKIEENMSRLTRLYKYLEQNYLWDIDHDKTYEAMAEALFSSLGDKYTYFVKAEDMDEYKESMMGTYGGLGFYFSKTYKEYQDENDLSTIYCFLNQIFPNTPASRSGLMAGDLITAIDGEDTGELSANDCAARMKGEAGTSVTLTILRNGATFDVTITREKISVPSVISDMLENSIGYLQILQFYDATASDISKAITDLMNKGMRGLIIDLRNNPGGDVTAALKIADMFISDADLLTVNYKHKENNSTYRAELGVKVPTRIRVAILINEYSASSSEIFSSTMRDNGRAVLVGTTTYGKGIMQAVSAFGDAEISVTVASFVPPSGEEIHQKGVEPDIPVPAPTVKDEEKEAYSALISTTLVRDYVAAHPQYTKENVLNFIKENPDTGVSDDVVALLVRNVYFSRMTYDELPRVDIWFDPQIRAAIDYIEEGLVL